MKGREHVSIEPFYNHDVSLIFEIQLLNGLEHQPENKGTVIFPCCILGTQITPI